MQRITIQRTSYHRHEILAKQVRKANKVRVLDIGCGVPRFFYDLIFDFIHKNEAHLLENLELVALDKWKTEKEVLTDQKQVLSLFEEETDNLSFQSVFESYILHCEEITPIINQDESQVHNIKEKYILPLKNRWHQLLKYQPLYIQKPKDLSVLASAEKDKFDVIVCEWFLHFEEIKPQAQEMLNEIVSMLKPQGMLCLKVYIDTHPRLPKGYMPFAKDEFRQLFKNNVQMFEVENCYIEYLDEWAANVWRKVSLPFSMSTHTILSHINQ